MAKLKITIEDFNILEDYMFNQFVANKVPLRDLEETIEAGLRNLNDGRISRKKTGTENNNDAKEFRSRPKIANCILNEFDKSPIAFIELLGSGVGAEFYSTWLNVDNMILIEKDKSKASSYNKTRIPTKSQLFNMDLNDYFKFHTKARCPVDVINLDFCTYLYDNNKENCTSYIINNMFDKEIIKDGGLVFFTFMIRGIGVNFNKTEAIVDENGIKNLIEHLALRNGYTIENILWFPYDSHFTTTMVNYGIKVLKAN